MNKFYITIAAIFVLASCKAQTFYKDQLEYGYKGKVKVVVKKNFNSVDEEFNSNPVLIYTYYFNESGNMDSAKTEKIFPFSEIFYKTIYSFDKLRKSGWTSFNENGEKLLHAKITWNSDKEFIEKVYDPNESFYETTNILNDSFRITKIKIKAFDKTGTLTQNDIQEFQLDKSQNIELYKTTNQNNGSSEITNYKYLENDKIGNPTKLVISKENRDTKILVTINYTYYE